MNQTGFVGELLRKYYLEKMPDNVRKNIMQVYMVGMGF